MKIHRICLARITSIGYACSRFVRHPRESGDPVARDYSWIPPRLGGGA